ncbi:MAG: CPBP family intramembrane metalloprotease [Deltaproteobacteria bacterium]|nr:MAG: CPBP family intramembrane metalloprotease [Deltaproteobacteria bacterium]
MRMELPGSEPAGPSRAGLIMALYGALALVAVLISAGRDDVDIYRIEGRSTATWLLLSPLVGAALGLAVVAASRAAVHRFAWARALHRDFRALLGPLTTREIVILAAASAVGEELLFRGALQPWIGVWPQALIFALLHVGPGMRFLPWTAWAFAMGLVFGYVFEWTGDLGAPIAAHFTINFLNLLFIARVELPPEPHAGAPPRPS